MPSVSATIKETIYKPRKKTRKSDRKTSKSDRKTHKSDKKTRKSHRKSRKSDRKKPTISSDEDEDEICKPNNKVCYIYNFGFQKNFNNLLSIIINSNLERSYKRGICKRRNISHFKE